MTCLEYEKMYSLAEDLGRHQEVLIKIARAIHLFENPLVEINRILIDFAKEA